MMGSIFYVDKKMAQIFVELNTMILNQETISKTQMTITTNLRTFKNLVYCDIMITLSPYITY